MNMRIIVYILGWILRIEAAFLLFPALTGACYGEATSLAYLGVSALCLLVGWLLSRRKPEKLAFYAREAYAITALSWMVMSLFGCLPFIITGEIPVFVDAFFEMVSGFTTTGASVVANVELLSHATNLWRCFSHWIGGMGVLVFLLAVLPMVGGSNLNLMRAESPGPSVGKLVPRMRYTARILYCMYLALTVAEFLCLLLAGMPVFDALCTAFGTAGTGGFGVKADSIAGYSSTIQWIVTIFMIIFGVNFNVYFLLYVRRWREALRSEEMRVYLLIILFSALLITFNILGAVPTFGEAFRGAAFQVASIITTTGYATMDFDLWPTFSKLILVLLMFIGACAGSTGGGLKVSRFVIAGKMLIRQLRAHIHSREVRTIRFEGSSADENTIRSIFVYFFAAMMIFCFSVVLVSLENQDLISTVTAVAATFNNIGPGLGAAGPTSNFAGFSVLSKYVMIFDMLAGRLEIFPMLVLLYPLAWRRTVQRQRTQYKEKKK